MELLKSHHDRACRDCKLGNELSRVVPSRLPEGAKVLLIDDKPGKEDSSKQSYFCGPAGKKFRQICTEVNINLSTVGIAYIVNCRPPDNQTPSKKEINTCTKYLYKEIEELKPELIVPLGSIALKTIFPALGAITQARGEMVTHPELKCQVLPTFSPSYLEVNPIERSKIVKDMKKVADFIDGKITVDKPEPVDYHIVTNRAQLDWVVNKLHTHDLWSCDTETTSLNPLEAEIFIISFSWETHSAVLLDSRYFKDDSYYFWSKVKEVMENKSRKVFQNGSYDIQCFITHEIYVRNFIADTMLMHYLLNENEKHGLELLAWEYTDIGGYDAPLEKYKNENKIDNYKDIPMDVIHPYAAADADVTLRAYLAMNPLIEEEGLSFVHNKVMIPTSKVLLTTEYNGVSIDVPYLEKTIESYTDRMEIQLDVVKNVPQVRQYEYDCIHQVKEEIKAHWSRSKTLVKRHPTFEDYLSMRLSKKPKLLDFEFNINSPKQLKELLIDRMKLPVIKKTKSGGACTDAEVLEEYAKKNEFCASISKYRTLSHLKSTFLDGIRGRLTEKNRVHTNYLLHSTVTGRPSSRDPNLNNIPRTGTADDIKDIFCCDPDIPGQPINWLCEADLAQAEFRMWIDYAKDKQALYDLNMGIDIHKLMAAAGKGKVIPEGNLPDDVYEELIADVIKPERQAAKNVVFGLMYGRGSASVAKQLGISKTQAEVIINAFFGRYPSAYKWIRTTTAHTRVDGYSKSLFGRKRRLKDILSSDSNKMAEAERQCINAPIQSAASDLTFMAAIRIHRYLWAKELKTRLVLTVYDSLIFNIPDNELQEVLALIHVEMKRKPEDEAFEPIIVPLLAELQVGTHWGSLEEIDITDDWNAVYNNLMKNREIVANGLLA